MSWDYTGQQGPVSFDHNATHQFYAPVQQQDDQQALGFDHGHGQEQGHGRYTPPTSGQQQQPAGSLGFYPNANAMQPEPSTYMMDQFFPHGYTLNPNHQEQQQHQHQQHQHQQQQQQPHPTYRPSPLSFDSAPTSYPTVDPQLPHTPHAGPSYTHGNSQHMSTPSHFDPQQFAQLLNMAVPGPRQAQQYHHENNQQRQQQQQQQQQIYDWGHLTNGNLHHGTPQTAPDAPCTDALAEYLKNPHLYGNLATAPLPEHSMQGTISPSQLGQGAINKQFSSLFMERGSTSSASSTEGGHDATAAGLLMEDVQHAAAGLRLGSLADARAYASTPPQSLISAPAPINGDIDASDANHAALVGYLTSSNRFAYGERRLVISTPKVGQKSYGNEKRFLCPPPQATLYGAAWWTTQGEGCPATPIVPPRINISLSGEEAVKDATATWTNLAGKSLDEKISQEAILKRDQPFVGNVAGRNLHISDTEGKRANFTAQVRIRAPSARRELAPQAWGGADLEPREIIGTFESKEIKVISKPSKKKTNTKSSELVITHGSTIALYNRTKSQTASTRYLNVETDLTSIRGSDGKYVSGAKPPASSVNGDQAAFQGMIASAGVWESFIVWLADPSKPNVPSGLPPNIPNGPSPPMNALAAGAIPPPIRYNSLVVLQSLQTGRCTPVMTIRRIDQDSEAVGSDGNAMDQNTGYAPEGEMPGDMVAQVQKVAFELYDPILASQVLLNRSAGDSRWMACDAESVIPRYVRTERRWSPIPIPYRGGKSHSTPTTPNRGFHILPMTPHTSSTNLPSTPSSPVSSGSSLDYFGAHSRKASSTHLISPISSNGEPLPMSTDGGPLRRHRTGSTGTGRAGPLGRPAHKKRQSQDSHSHSHPTSASSSYDHLPNALGNMLDHRQSWSLSVGDTAVWTIVGTEQVSYTFYVPSTVSVSDNPIAPFPTATKVSPPGAEKNDKRTEIGYTPSTDLPLVHLYGKGFSKAVDGPKYDVYFGDHKSRHIEARCEEVMAAAEPAPGVVLPAPITLVRKDGRCILPTGLVYDLPTQGQGHQAGVQPMQVHPQPANQMAPPTIPTGNRPRSQYK